MRCTVLKILARYVFHGSVGAHVYLGVASLCSGFVQDEQSMPSVAEEPMHITHNIRGNHSGMDNIYRDLLVDSPLQFKKELIHCEFAFGVRQKQVKVVCGGQIRGNRSIQFAGTGRYGYYSTSFERTENGAVSSSLT